MVIRDRQKLSRFLLLTLGGAGCGILVAVGTGFFASHSAHHAPPVRPPMLATPSGRVAIMFFLLIWGGAWFSQVFFMMFRPEYWVRWSNWGNRWFGLELLIVDRKKHVRYSRWMGLFFILMGAAVVATILMMESVHPAK